MKPSSGNWLNPLTSLFTAALAITCAVNPAEGDQIQMQNGDRYVGKLLSVNGESLLLQNDNLGPIRLPRTKIAWIAFGSAAPTNGTFMSAASNAPAITGPFALTNGSSVKSMPLRLGITSNMVHQIESQYLSDASPESKDMFNQLMGGLMSGKLDVQDIRAQAQSTANQVRALRKDLGDEAGFMLDTYLAILDHFVKETTPTGGAVAVPKSPPVPKVRQPGATAEAD